MNEKIAIVTGSSSGIGKSCCIDLLKTGCTIIGIDVNQKSIDNQNYIHLIMNITDEETVKEEIKKIYEKFGKIDYLVNAAGTFSNGKPFYEIDLEKWNKVLSINLTGTFIISKHVSQCMIKQNYGKIVNIACIRSTIFKQNMSDYASSKAAVVALTSTMALDLVPYNIQVNAVAPGFTYTGMTARAFDQADIKKASEALIPCGKIAQADDISPVVLFLLSGGSNYITGTTIFADGGYSIQK